MVADALTRELLEKYPDNLPVGVIKPGTTVLVMVQKAEKSSFTEIQWQRLL